MDDGPVADRDLDEFQTPIILASASAQKNGMITRKYYNTRNRPVQEPTRSRSRSRAAMTTNKDWPAAAVFSVQSNAIGWRVIVVRNPNRIGSHCSIEIDKKGKVTGYYGGM
jgi:hypothetical protein